MWSGDGDIPGTCFVVDLEWIGNSHIPSQAHVTQIAAKCVKTSNTFSCKVRPFASLASVKSANAALGKPSEDEGSIPAADAFMRFIQFVRSECGGDPPAVLIAHNGIRFDSPILLENMRRSGISVPHNIVFLDSLHHFRHHLRHRETCTKFDLDSICALLEVPVDASARHSAMYDVELLHKALTGMQKRWNIPYISGLPQHLDVFSPMLVRGVGPTVCMYIGANSLLALGGRIIDETGGLTPECCHTYLQQLNLSDKLPALDMATIAKHIGPTAERYLHYLP